MIEGRRSLAIILQSMPFLQWRRDAIDLIGVTVLIGWFLHFALKPAPPPYFRGDDMTNLFAYWSQG